VGVTKKNKLFVLFIYVSLCPLPYKPNRNIIYTPNSDWVNVKFKLLENNGMVAGGVCISLFAFCLPTM